jgi:thiamine biosynthesis lipoprotein
MPPGLELDLGATAKAVAADRAVDLVHARLRTGVLVSLGGDIATAGPAPGSGWQVRVQDRAEDPSTQVALVPGTAIATSSTVSRQWQRGGRTVHHVVDPYTGASADPYWRSVTVAASSCVRANAVTTAALVRGPKAVAWVRDLGLPARFVRHDGRILLTEGWPGEDAA